MKFLLAPDSFKGTLPAQDFCDTVEKVIRRRFSEAEVLSFPIADGGEGSAECFARALNGEICFVPCRGPFFEDIRGFYCKAGGFAAVETATAAGLPLAEGKKNSLAATTYGVGELLLAALRSGAKRIAVGLGGSCTNDFGCGAAAACGAKFFDAEGREFLPVGGTLERVEKIDLTALKERFIGVELTAMCDVDNPPYGENGAAAVFAPQKGADAKAVEILDRGVRHLCGVVSRELGIRTDGLAGGGAAGAMGAGLFAFFGAGLRSGIETVLDAVGFDDALKGADAVITGEGKLDGQSVRGKAITGIAKRAKRKGVPVLALVGGAEGDLSAVYEAGVTAVFPINRLPQDLSISAPRTRENLAATADDVLRLFSLHM